MTERSCLEPDMIKTPMQRSGQWTVPGPVYTRPHTLRPISRRPSPGGCPTRLCHAPPAFNVPGLMGGTGVEGSQRLIRHLAEVSDPWWVQMPTQKAGSSAGSWELAGGTVTPAPKAGPSISPRLPTSPGLFGAQEHHPGVSRSKRRRLGRESRLVPHWSCRHWMGARYVGTCATSVRSASWRHSPAGA